MTTRHGDVGEPRSTASTRLQSEEDPAALEVAFGSIIDRLLLRGESIRRVDP